MKIKLTPKKIFYNAFPEYKGGRIDFIELSRDDNMSSGQRVKVEICMPKETHILDFTIEYFDIKIIN